MDVQSTVRTQSLFIYVKSLIAAGVNQSKACIVGRPNSQEPVRVTVYINSSLFELKYENPHIE